MCVVSILSLKPKGIITIYGRLVPVLSLFSILIWIGFIRFWLKEGLQRAKGDFLANNYSELSRLDTLTITDRLNSLSSGEPWKCVVAKYNGTVFFRREKGDCSEGVFARRTVLSDNDIKIDATFGIPNYAKVFSLLFVLVEAAVLGLSIRFTALEHRERIARQLYIADLARQTAHDIRSPLLALDLVGKLGSLTEAPNRDMFNMAIQRIRAIADRLLLAHREQIAPTDQRLRGARCVLQDEVTRIVAEKRIELNGAASQIQIEFDPDLESSQYSTKVSPVVVQTVVSNVLNNAIEASKGSDLIKVSLISNRKFHVIECRDQGVGISKKSLQKIGKKIFSEGKNNSDSPGNGLGLYSATKQLLEFGASLKIESALGKGTTVKISLPKLT